MYSTTAALSLAITLTSPVPRAEITAVDDTSLEFDHGEVNVDEDGTLELLAFDASGALVGTLIAYPTDEYVQIDAQFEDGYASIHFPVCWRRQNQQEAMSLCACAEYLPIKIC